MAKKRTSGHADPQPADKPRKLTFAIPADLARRFAVHAEMLDLDKTELFCELIRTHCRRFSVHDRAKEPGASAEAGAA
jgi:hypothetical protein